MQICNQRVLLEESGGWPEPTVTRVVTALGTKASFGMRLAIFASLTAGTGCRFFLGDDPPRSSDAAIEACATATFSLPRISSFQDDFSVGALSDRWTDTVPCIQQSGGELVAEPPDVAQEYCVATTQGAFHLTCDSVTVEVPEVTSSQIGVQTVIYVIGPGTARLQLFLESGGFLLSLDEGSFEHDAGPYDPAVDRWWRLRESDGELFFETSPDGAAWTMRTRDPDPIVLDNVVVTLGAGTWQAIPSPGRARFHCFNVPPPCT